MKKIPVREQCPQVVTLSLFLGPEIDSYTFVIRGHVLFGTQWLAINSESGLRYGIRRGEMRLDLDGAKSPISGRAFIQPRPSVIQLKIRDVKVSNSQKESGLSGEISSKRFGVGTEVGGGSGESTYTEKEYNNSCELLIWTQGPEFQPSWVFKVKPDEHVLEGTVPAREWATLRPLSRRLDVRVRFSVAASDIVITMFEHPRFSWSHPNKKGIIRAYLLKRLKGYLRKNFEDAGCFWGGELILNQGEVSYDVAEECMD